MALAEDSSISPATIYFDPDNYSYYDYDNSTNDEICNKTIIIQFGAVFNPIFFSIVVILSLLGNILVIIILAKYENLKSITNVFILNLAISDLLFTVGLPFWAYYHMYGWNLGEPACKIVNFIFSVGFYSSGILIMLMTIHRYTAVINPLSGILSAAGIYSGIASVIVWTMSMLVSLPAYISTKVLQQNYCEYIDSNWSLFGIYLQNVLFLLNSLVFIFCYSKIICRLLNSPGQRRKNKTLKLIFTLMVVFFFGWSPYSIVIFLKSLYFWTNTPVDSDISAIICQNYKQLEYAYHVSRLIAFSHCCLNPVFYVFVGVRYKNHLKKMLKSWNHSTPKHNRSTHSRQNRLTITSLSSGEECSF